jgi:uncharacterized protein
MSAPQKFLTEHLKDMKPKLLLCSLFIVALAHAQNDNKIVIGTIDSVYSKTLNEQRKIWVSVPKQGLSIFAPRKYPVVYLLDGDAHFPSVTGMLQQLSSVNGNTVVPEMIVVGIPNTDRTRDLTPTHTDLGPDGKVTPMGKSSGGGEKFIAFIKNELIPHIDSLYPTAPYRMFIGHSLGGLMVMNTLINHPEMFNSYIAIDPSMWWDNQKLLKRADSVLQRRNYDEKTLFLAVANTMAKGMDTTKVIKDTAGSTMHIRSNLQLARMLQKHKNNHLAWNWKYYNEDSHGSVPLIAEYDALHYFFKQMALQLPTSPEDTAFFTAPYVEHHYENVSKQMGYKMLPPEELINTLAYQFMSMNMMDKAQSFFQLNIDNYPQSFNVFDSMGDLFKAKGDKKKAIEFYTKALAIKDFPDTRKKIESLSRKAIQLDAVTLQKYAGEYELAPGFILTISVRNNEVFAQGTGQGETPIYAEKEDHFFLEVVPAQIEFVKNSNGKVEQLILHQNGKDTLAKRVK